MSEIQLYKNIINTSEPELNIQNFIEKTNYNIESLYIDQFWNCLRNNKWLYVDKELLEWMGYVQDSLKELKKQYIDLLSINFKDDIDYKHLKLSEYNDFIKNNEVIVNEENMNKHNKAYHLIISPKTFKKSLMILRTNKAERIREYYFSLEELFINYMDYQKLYTETKLEEYKNKYLQLPINKEKVKKSCYIYIATCKDDAERNYFKVGYSVNPKTRLSNYNTVRPNENNRYYLCFKQKVVNAEALEKILFVLLNNFRINTDKEMFNLHFDALKDIVLYVCKKDHESLLYVNGFIDKQQEHYRQLEPFIPRDIINDHIDEEDNQLNVSQRTLSSDNLSNEFNNYGLKLINYNGNNESRDQLFECNSIFKHSIKSCLDDLRRLYNKNGTACAKCTKHCIVDHIKLYSYDSKTLEYIEEFNNIEELKSRFDENNITSNLTYIRNSIREKRWLHNLNGITYSVLAPYNNKLNFNKNLTDYEKEIIRILDINYQVLVDKYSDRKIYVINEDKKIIYISPVNWTGICNYLSKIDEKNKVNRKTAPSKLNTDKIYCGYLWRDYLDETKYSDYEKIFI